MNSYQLLYELKKLQDILQRQSYLTELLGTFPQNNETISTSAITIIRDSGGVPSTDNRKLTAEFDKIMRTLKAVKSREVFTNINRLEEAFVSFSESDGDTQVENEIAIIHKYLLNFSSAYEKYLNSLADKERETALINLIFAGGQLSSALEVLTAIFSDIIHKLEGHVDIYENENLTRFSLFLESHTDFAQFTQKLHSINVIYLELCVLLNLSPLEHPMIIVKVESGSAWTELLAYPKIVELLVTSIERASEYLYRTFTTEGKIVALPRKVEAVEEILELRKKLAAVGIDTTKIDDELTKSTYVIADELNKLLIGEHKVVLNGKVFSVGSSFEKKYLEASKKYMLPLLEQGVSNDTTNE